MGNYRISINSQWNPELNYYFNAKTDDIAKKYFFVKMREVLNYEINEFDKVTTTSDHLKITVFSDGKEYIKGQLHYLPNRFKEIDMLKLEDYKLDDIFKGIKNLAEKKDSFKL